MKVRAVSRAVADYIELSESACLECYTRKRLSGAKVYCKRECVVRYTVS